MISDLKEQFDELKASLADLSGQLATEKPRCFFPLSDAERLIDPNPINWVNDLLSDLWYHDAEQDGRVTRCRHGLVLASPVTLEKITQVNESKAAFTEVARKLRNQSGQQSGGRAKNVSDTLWSEACQLLTRDGSSFRNLAKNSGMSRLHLKQCNRLIPIIAEQPVSCRFSWYTNGRSIKRLSVRDVETMLLEIGEHKTHIQVQLERLKQLPAHTPLARIQPLAPTVRANLVFEGRRKAMNCPLPLFVATEDPHGPLPDIKDVPLHPPEGRTRKAREDNQISDDPIFPSLRVYTYRR